MSFSPREKNMQQQTTYFENINQPLLYPKGRTVTKEKRKDTMNLLKFVSLNTSDEDYINFVDDDSF